jgi:hypothetical protein
MNRQARRRRGTGSETRDATFGEGGLNLYTRERQRRKKIKTADRQLPHDRLTVTLTFVGPK